MSSIIHLPGMRYIRDGQVESMDQQQQQQQQDNNSNKKLDLLPQQWKPHQQFNGQEKLTTSGFYHTSAASTADYAQYETLLRSRSYLVEPTAPSAPSQYGFSPQQMYASPAYFPTTSHHHEHQHQEQALDLQKRPIRKRRRPPHSYASLIAQAILTSRDQRLTLREIYEWVQTRYPHLYEANETGWQNTIRHNLSLNRCFRKLPRLSSHQQSQGQEQQPQEANANAGKGKGSKGGYWTVDLEQLNNTNFGRQILDSGFLGNIEYWHQQQQQQQQQEQEQQQQQQLIQGANDGRGLNIVNEIDFNTLVVPFYASAATATANTATISQVSNNSEDQNDQRYTTTDETDETTARMASFLARFSKRPISSLGSMSSSKTSSVRGSTSPHSPASSTTDMNSTPILSSSAVTHQLQYPQHQKMAEMDPSSLLNPSLMRVNNILN